LAKKKKSSRVAARKLKDKWRSKNWYNILAPDMFQAAPLGETFSDSPTKLIDRTSEVTLQDLTGDFTKMHVKLRFKINDVKGTNAHTKFIGHDLTSDYIRRQTRRKRSKMDGVYDVSTKDGYLIRVKPMAFAEKRIQTSQQYAIRKVMYNVIKKAAMDKTLGEFVHIMIYGELPNTIFKMCKPIYPIKRVEIRKSEIIEEPAPGVKKPKAVIKVEKDEEKPVEPEPETDKDKEKKPKVKKKKVTVAAKKVKSEDEPVEPDKTKAPAPEK
jgi:small subunit ribosomal protein S3Ae